MGGRARGKDILRFHHQRGRLATSTSLEKSRARWQFHEWGMGERLYYEPEKHDAESEINRLLETADNEAHAAIQAQKENTEKLAQALFGT